MGKIVKLKNANNVYTYPITKTEAVYIEDNKTTLKDYLNATAIIKTVGPAQMVTFNDGANNIPVKSCIINLESYQEGTGDPSPTNIRPISGRTGLTVTRAGENLFTPLNARNTTANGVNIVSDGNGTITMTGTATANDYASLFFPSPIIIPDGAIFKFCLLNTQASTESIFRFVNGSTIVDSWSPNVVNREMNYSGMSGKEVTGVRIYITNGTTYNMTMQPMFVPKTVSVNGYIPYTATTYPITWQTEAGTVYGGTLDVTTGVLIITGVCHSLTGTEEFALQTNARRFVKSFSAMRWEKSAAVSAITNASNSICSHSFYNTESVASATPADYRISVDSTGANAIFFYDTQSVFADTAAFNAYLAEQYTNGTPVQVYYDLKTPFTPIQLSPIEIKALLGGNTIYTDVGTVNITYIVDTKKYIDNKFAELQALTLGS